ncbi:GNAT family N-acetyltransferase [uncultured Nocardioides sp.]|uniref:GNAT family N-acetyltransferase n=1 Tax=uncultured Nocardioides sp. TaxID=198441 RepID=UPI00262BB94C|nr:GNAT family N-acetyltransferase [uncultured Nocardioides sp.]
MSGPRERPLRLARLEDATQLVRLWSTLFDPDEDAGGAAWVAHAHAWFAGVVDDPTARFPVVEDGGEVVATAIGTLEVGVPNPMCPRGRTVQLKNVVTRPELRGHGHGTALVRDVVDWARSVDADRVDLSATPEGRGIYEKAGFVLTSAPRMKLVL